MSAQMAAWRDQQDAALAETIRRHGWSIQYIAGGLCEAPGCDCPEDDDGPPFAYTVGLFGLGHPELLVFGLDVHDSLGLLNSLGDRIRAGETLLPGQILTVGEWPHRIVPETVPNPGEIVFDANRFYRRPDHASVDVIQLTYDDSVGRFPWDDGYADLESQPRPGTFQA